MTERIQVAVEIGGVTVPAGTLHVETGRTLNSTFLYSPEYLARPGGYPLDPHLPLQSAPHHVQGLPGAFEDAAPDRWGRNLIRRSVLKVEKRQPSEVDFLLGVSDRSRQGALRFSRDAGGPYLSDDKHPPKLLQLPHLMRAADHVGRSSETDDDVKTLLDAGSGSLGGARPKASVVDGGALCIAKFPHHQDPRDVLAWEATALDLAALAGIVTPPHRILRLPEGTVLLLRRFDRDGEQRVGYMSAMALLAARDGQQQDYLDIAEELAAQSGDPVADLRGLWTRAAFSVAINNTDDHLRNHGFLRIRAGWRLAPAFDLNPNPQLVDRQTSIGGATSREECAQALVEWSASFGLSRSDTVEIIGRIEHAVGQWARLASANGVARAEVGALEPAFNTAVFPPAPPPAAST